jgi:hydrogenase maturation protease
MNKKRNNLSQSDIARTDNRIVKVIGFGNIFMGDDGIGIRVIEKLREDKELKDLDNVELIDGGTSGIDLIFILQQAEKAIIIDAVDAGQEKGEIIEFTPDDIKKIKQKKKGLKSFSLHDIDLNEVFELIKTLKLKIDVRIIGIKPFIVKYSEKISPEIKQKIPDLVERVKKEI